MLRHPQVHILASFTPVTPKRFEHLKVGESFYMTNNFIFAYVKVNSHQYSTAHIKARKFELKPDTHVWAIDSNPYRLDEA